MKYLKLFSISLLHDYYQNGICTDIDLAPTERTLTNFKNYRLVYKPKPNGCTVLVGMVTDSDGEEVTKIPLPSAETFEFELHLNHATFDSFTTVPSMEPLVFTKITSSDKLWGKVSFNINDLSQPDKLRFDTDLKIQFTTKESVWEYYLLTDTDIEASDLAIEQNSLSGENINFLNASEITHTATSTIAKKTLAQFPDKKLFSIASEGKVKFRQSVQKNLELIVNKKVINRNLPNPGTDSQPIVIKCISN